MQPRQVTIDTPLGPEVLIFRRMTGREELGRLFEYEVEMVSDKHDVALRVAQAKAKPLPPVEEIKTPPQTETLHVDAKEEDRP